MHRIVNVIKAARVLPGLRGTVCHSALILWLLEWCLLMRLEPLWPSLFALQPEGVVCELFSVPRCQLIDVSTCFQGVYLDFSTFKILLLLFHLLRASESHSMDQIRLPPCRTLCGSDWKVFPLTWGFLKMWSQGTVPWHFLWILRVDHSEK